MSCDKDLYKKDYVPLWIKKIWIKIEHKTTKKKWNTLTNKQKEKINKTFIKE